jgi:hypothetical protein
VRLAERATKGPFLPGSGRMMRPLARPALPAARASAHSYAPNFQAADSLEGTFTLDTILCPAYTLSASLSRMGPCEYRHQTGRSTASSLRLKTTEASAGRGSGRSMVPARLAQLRLWPTARQLPVRNRVPVIRGTRADLGIR